MSLRSTTPSSTKFRQSGLTLVEILITAVIISVGLLGVAALHLTSLRNGYDSNSRSQATWLANDIADHMRANLVAAQAGDYNTGFGTPPAISPIAAADLLQWKSQLGTPPSGLPSGDGSISLVPVGGTSTDQIVTVNVRWNEHGTSQTLTMQFGI